MNKNATYLKKLNSESVVQQVINCLTEAMINKELKPGDKIPTELELSETLGVGRNSIRFLFIWAYWKYAGQKGHLCVKAFPRV